MPWIRYAAPARGTRYIPLDGDLVTLGRSKSCDVVLDDDAASRKHCEVRKLGGGHILVDLGSKNGTFVNGAPVSTWTLSDGDLIAVGNQQMVYKLQR